ncbi:hypothetical protein HanRHA438_Chr10g0460111 [Helianthus annuus]|nr:hypothetical protein HanRHA438_Chr10g0460111 [Helianthus annuus]
MMWRSSSMSTLFHRSRPCLSVTNRLVNLGCFTMRELDTTECTVSRPTDWSIPRTQLMTSSVAGCTNNRPAGVKGSFDSIPIFWEGCIAVAVLFYKK